MDVLKNKETKSREYLSRYSSFPFYYNSLDNKYVYGLTKHIRSDIPYVLINVTFDTTLDQLAYKYYGRPDLYWVIADFNRIQDPFANLFDNFEKIKIPSISSIEYI